MDSTTRSTSPPAPRPAATLVVMRDGPSGVEVLLTTRPRTMRFMGGASVFPGGAVAPSDRDPRWAAASRRAPEECAMLLGEDDPGAALGWFVCALRESFEEVGLLLAEGPADAVDRRAADDPERFLDACRAAGVVLATDRLVPAGRWVTPVGSPVRFDARFFLARAPDGWEPDPDPGEVEDVRWQTPPAALVDLASGRALMAPPTIEVLQRLEGAEHVDDALALPARPDGAPLSVALSPLVHVVLAPNPGIMTGPGTNTYVVSSGPAVVIDPAVDDKDYLDAVVAAARGPIRALLVTHRHGDHVGGAAALAARTGAPVCAYGEEDAGGAPVTPLSDGDVVEAGGERLVALHTPGHASDHLCFLLEGAAALFSGDTILGEGTAVIAPPDGDMRAYLGSLRRLTGIHLERVYPGHFRPLDRGAAVVEDYLAHRAAREEAILAALAGGPATIPDLVARVYTDTPPQLHPIAEYSVRAHLEMAEEEGRVVRDNDYWALSENDG